MIPAPTTAGAAAGGGSPHEVVSTPESRRFRSPIANTRSRFRATGVAASFANASDSIRDAAAATDDAARTGIYRAFQKQVVDDVALINVAEFSFTTVASTRVGNVSNNPRWAVSNWADVWLDA
jgi:ABC-type transport system substrate-binding protein